MLSLFLTSLLGRLRGHNFTDYHEYQLETGGIKPWENICNAVFSKHACMLYIGFVWWFAAQNSLFGLIVALGMMLGATKGWTLEALKGDKSAIIPLTLRGSHFLPMFIALWFFCDANPLSGILCLSLGVVQYLCYFLPINENAKLEPKLINRLWKGKAEMNEIIFWLILGGALYASMLGIPAPTIEPTPVTTTNDGVWV